MKINRFRKLTDQKWLNLFDVNFIDKNGKNKHWQLASRNKVPKCVTGEFSRPDAVIIVPFHRQQGKLVITKEYRVTLADYEYGFPAGLVEQGESLQETARRELMEETGLNLTRFDRISPPIYSSAGMTDESISMVYVECSGRPSVENARSSEDIEVILVTAAEASVLCADRRLKFDARVWLVLFQFGERGRI